MNVANHQEKEKNEKTFKRKEGEDRPILKRLRATLLWSFRGLHGEKMVCVRRVPGVTGTLGKANSHFDPTQTGRGPHHHFEAAVDWCSSILLALHVHTIYKVLAGNMATLTNFLKFLKNYLKVSGQTVHGSRVSCYTSYIKG